MPTLDVAGATIDIPRNAALIDANVLVARFNERDELHEQAYVTLEDDHRFEWLVTAPVIIEACGVLMSRRGRSIVLQMLRWLITPGNRVILLAGVEGVQELEKRLPDEIALIAARNIDAVDAYLMRLASLLTEACQLVPNMPILTSDADFYRGGGAGMKYSVVNLHEPTEVVPMG